MRTKRFLQSCAAMIAVAMGLVACQEDDINTQGDTTPKLVTDAQSSYVANPVGAESIVFKVSSNMPWRITVDCGEKYSGNPWLTASPSLSAVSSLVEDVTLAIKDNDSEEERTATVTIEAENVEEPVVISVRQTGKGNLTVILTSADPIPDTGGNVTFSVTSNRDWTVSGDSWLTFDKTSGSASAEPVTVTATASASATGRTATVIVKTDIEEKKIEIRQEGFIPVMDFDAERNTETQFKKYGETRTYYVNANVDWKVTSDNKFAKLEKVDDGSFTVTLPFSTYFADHTSVITLTDESGNNMPAKTMTISQPTGFKIDARSGNEKITVDADGAATITASNWGQGYLNTTESGYRFGFGTFTITFSELTVTTGRLHLNNWGGSDGNLQYQLRFGGGNEDGNRLDTGGKINDIRWGENDWTGIRTALPNTSYSQSDLSGMKTIKLQLLPKDGDDTKVCFSVWADDRIVLEKAERNNVWRGATADEIAFKHDNVSGLGVDYYIGVDGSFGGKMVIESFLYEPYSK